MCRVLCSRPSSSVVLSAPKPPGGRPAGAHHIHREFIGTLNGSSSIASYSGYHDKGIRLRAHPGHAQADDLFQGDAFGRTRTVLMGYARSGRPLADHSWHASGGSIHLVEFAPPCRADRIDICEGHGDASASAPHAIRWSMPQRHTAAQFVAQVTLWWREDALKLPYEYPDSGKSVTNC